MDFSFLLSLLAFIMSSITWVVHAFQHSTHFSVQVIDFVAYSDNILFFLYFQNNSSSPITVSGISYITPDKKYPCELVPKVLRTEHGIVTRSTPNFPLNFAPSQGAMYFIDFRYCPGNSLDPDKMVDFEIYTNRGRLNKSVALASREHLLRLR